MAISDIVAFAELPESIQHDITLFTGCMAGASLISEMEEMLKTAGFQQIRVTPKNESKTFIRDWAPGLAATEYIVSATIEAIKPVTYILRSRGAGLQLAW